MKKPAFYILGIIIHLLFLFSLQFGFLDSFFCDSTHRLGIASDFFTHYQASTNYWEGKSLYQPIDTLGKSKVVPYCYQDFRFFPSSPFIVGSFITSFSPWTGYCAWIIVYEIMLFTMLFYARKLCPERFHYSFLLGMAFTPYYVELFMGQFSFFVAFWIFFLGYGFLKKNRILTALSFYGTVFIKYYGVIFLPLMVWKRQVFVLALFIPLLAITFIPYFCQYPEDFQLLKEAHAFGGSHAGNLGLRSFLFVLGDVLTGTRLTKELPDIEPPKPVPLVERPLLSRILYDYLWLSLLVLMAWRTISGDQDPILLLALWTSFFFMISKDVWEHHYVVLMPIFFLLNAKFDSSFLRWCSFFIAIPTPFFGLMDPQIAIHTMLDPEPYWGSLELVLYHSVKISAVFAFFFYLSFCSPPSST